jgi:hypothetical protein
MDVASSKSTNLRVPVSLLEYPGMRCQIRFSDNLVVLEVLNPGSETQPPLVEIRLPPTDFVLRQGRLIQFRSTFSGSPDGSIDFAGMSRNAWYHARCNDEASAEIAAGRIEQLRKARYNPLLKYFDSLLPE